MTLITRIILWIARISGTLLIAILLLLLIASGGGSPDILAVFFTAGLIIGLGLAFKWEGLGRIARISGSLILAFVLAILLAGDFLTTDLGDFSPVIGLIIGLGLALKWEGLGGSVATLSMIYSFYLRPDLIGDTELTGMCVPGLLYLIYWVLAKLFPSPVHQAIQTDDSNQGEL